MAANWVFRAVLAGLTLTSPPQPLFLSANTPQQLTLAVESLGPDFLGPSTGFNLSVSCATDRADPRAPRDVFFSQQLLTNITTSNVRQGQQVSMTIPGVSITDRYKQVFCDIITTANSGDRVQIAYGPNPDLGNAKQQWNPQLTWRVGPNLNGSSTSYMTSGNDDIQATGWGFDVEFQQLQGARIEAWYRCDGPGRPVYDGDSSATRNPLAGGDGVFYSNAKDLDQTQLLSFSHNATQLCGLATRFNTTSNTFATFQACSQTYNSTAGQWVHGAMVFEMLPARFSFFINGVQIPTIPPAVTPPVATAGDGSFIPLENNYLLGGRGTNGAYYIRAGTSIDQIRLYPTTANFAADIAASWNRAAPSASTRNGTYVSFHHSGAQRELIWRQPDAQSAGRQFFSLQSSGTTTALPTFLTQSTEPRSCNRAGCGEFGTTGFDGPAAAVSPPQPQSSSSSTGGSGSSSSSGAGTNTTTTSSSTGPASNSSTAPAAGASSSGANGFVTGAASVVSPAGVFMAAVASLASLAAMLL